MTFLGSVTRPRGQRPSVPSRELSPQSSRDARDQPTTGHRTNALPPSCSPCLSFLAPLPRAPDQTRERKVDLSSKLGKTQVVTAASTPSQQGGWYCETCKCGLKDSINYLDHINGKKHQKELGYSMRVERSTVSQVRRFVLARRTAAEAAEAAAAAGAEAVLAGSTCIACS